MTLFQIRQAGQQDKAALVAFNQAMALETENKTLDQQILTAGVEGLLSVPTRGFYLVAEHQGQIVGSLMVTFEWSDWRNANFWWVQSVYVKPEFRRQGIYSALYRQVQTLGTESGDVCGYRLYVEKNNNAAQQTYRELGMAPSYYDMYESGDT